MVDLPLPLVPTRAQLVPAGTFNEAPFAARAAVGQTHPNVG